MSVGLIILVTMAYLGVAASELYAQQYGMCLVFMGYSFANIGLIWNMVVR